MQDGEPRVTSLTHLKGETDPQQLYVDNVQPKDFHEELHQAIRAGDDQIDKAMEQLCSDQCTWPAPNVAHILANLNKTKSWLVSQPLEEPPDPHRLPQTQFLQQLPDEINIDDLPSRCNFNEDQGREITIDSAGHSHTLGDSDQFLQASQTTPPQIEDQWQTTIVEDRSNET